MTLLVANGLNLTEYDKTDLFDFDGDGNVNEPDGIIDHIMLFHSSGSSSRYTRKEAKRKKKERKRKHKTKLERKHEYETKGTKEKKKDTKKKKRVQEEEEGRSANRDEPDKH